jgi:GR25 family glycosyltransferase involved in LPS biosynthesis
VYRHASLFFDLNHDSIEYDPAWEKIDIIYILNLKERSDRFNDTLLALCAVKAPIHRIHHYKAEKDGLPPYIGATKNHVDVMKHFKQSGKDTCLILEDDIKISNKFMKKSDPWWKLREDVPVDWDILYLGIHGPIGNLVNANVRKLRHATQDEGNWGTHAYIVRHGALKTKILPWLVWMIDSIDLQMNIKFDEWNVYCFREQLLFVDKKIASDSTIQTM